MRRLIARLHGEQRLLDFTDGDFDRELGFVTTDASGRTVPTVCGLLLIGRAERLKALLPTAGASLQVLIGIWMRRSVDFDIPVASAFEKILNEFREAVPLVLGRTGPFPEGLETAFREGLANAFAHRDYARVGRVRVAMSPERVTISSPAEFLGAVSPANVLNAPPAGRNTLLSDALKRIGLAARAGRGVERIFAAAIGGVLERPYYTESTDAAVVLALPIRREDAEFRIFLRRAAAELLEEPALPELLVLSVLRTEGDLPPEELVKRLPSGFDPAQVRRALARLAALGVVGALPDGRLRLVGLNERDEPETPEGDAPHLPKEQARRRG